MQSPRFNVHVAAGLAAFGFTAIRLLAAPLTLASAEQAVIEALITQDRDTRWDEKHIIADTTQAPFTYLKYEDFVEDLRRTAARRDQPFREALEDFITKNKTSVQFALPTNAIKSIELMPRTTLSNIFSIKKGSKSDGWAAFHERFPGAHGLITISRVGTDVKGTVAIIYLCVQRGARSSGDRIRVLRRESGGWMTTNEQIGPEGVF